MPWSYKGHKVILGLWTQSPAVGVVFLPKLTDPTPATFCWIVVWTVWTWSGKVCVLSCAILLKENSVFQWLIQLMIMIIIIIIVIDYYYYYVSTCLYYFLICLIWWRWWWWWWWCPIGLDYGDESSKHQAVGAPMNQGCRRCGFPSARGSSNPSVSAIYPLVMSK